MPVRYALRIPLSGLLSKLRPAAAGLVPHVLSRHVLALLQRVPPDIRRKTRLVLSAPMQHNGDSTDWEYRHDLAFIAESSQPWVPLSSATDLLKCSGEFAELDFFDCVYRDEISLRDFPGPDSMNGDGYVLIPSNPRSAFRREPASSYALNPQLRPGQMHPDDRNAALRAIQEQLEGGCGVTLCLDLDGTVLLHDQTLRSRGTFINPDVVEFLKAVKALDESHAESGATVRIQFITQRRLPRHISQSKMNELVARMLSSSPKPSESPAFKHEMLSDSRSVLSIIRAMNKQLPEWFSSVCHASCPHLGVAKHEARVALSKRAWLDEYHNKHLIGRTRQSELCILLDDTDKELSTFVCEPNENQRDRDFVFQSVEIARSTVLGRAGEKMKQLTDDVRQEVAFRALASRSPSSCGFMYAESRSLVTVVQATDENEHIGRARSASQVL